MRRSCYDSNHIFRGYAYFPSPVNFQQIQFATKRYRQGLDPVTGLECLYEAQVQFRTELRGEEAYNLLWTTEPKIVSNELIVSTQRWLLFKPGAEAETEVASQKQNQNNSGNDIPTSLALSLHQCPHYDTWYIGNIIRRKRTYFERSGHRNQPSESFRCEDCHTEFQIDATALGKDDVAILTTSWKALDLAARHLAQSGEEIFLMEQRGAEQIRICVIVLSALYFRRVAFGQL